MAALLSIWKRCQWPHEAFTDPFPSSTGANDLSALKRYPSQLRRYLSWSREINATYGSIPNFVCQERLHWTPSTSEAGPQGTTSNGTQASGLEPRNSIPFADPADYKILRNDWPYATPPGIAHLVIWLKTPLAVSKLNGFLLPEGRAQIEPFVDEKFVKPLKEIHRNKESEDLVLWFKNYPAVQSVEALEHFHCFVWGADDALLREWTGEGKRAMM